jgi:hypothetical protein
VHSYLRYLVLTQIFFFASFANADILKTSVQTTDKVGSLQITYETPKTKQGLKRPLAIFVGGVYSDADGLMSSDFSARIDRRFLFKSIARSLNAAGIATVRFDQRGTTGNVLTCPPNIKSFSEAAYITSCLDSKVRATIEAKSQGEDILTVFRYARELPHVDKKKIMFIAHSEASVHVSRLIEEKLVEPAAVFFISGLAQSRAAVTRWQTSDRFINWVKFADLNNDGLTTEDEIAEKVSNPNEPLLAEVSAENIKGVLRSPKGWSLNNIAALRQKVESEMQQAREHVKKPDSTAFSWGRFGELQFTLASYEWYRAQILDDAPVALMLKNYKGKIVYVLGELDMNVDTNSQIAALQQAGLLIQSNVTTRILKGIDHRLGRPGEKPYFDVAAMNEVANLAVKTLKNIGGR